MRIRETLALALIASGVGWLGWTPAAPERALLIWSVAVGELTVGIWLLLLKTGKGKEN